MALTTGLWTGVVWVRHATACALRADVVLLPHWHHPFWHCPFCPYRCRRAYACVDVPFSVCRANGVGNSDSVGVALPCPWIGLRGWLRVGLLLRQRRSIATPPTRTAAAVRAPSTRDAPALPRAAQPALATLHTRSPTPAYHMPAGSHHAAYWFCVPHSPVYHPPASCPLPCLPLSTCPLPALPWYCPAACPDATVRLTWFSSGLLPFAYRAYTTTRHCYQRSRWRRGGGVKLRHLPPATCVGLRCTAAGTCGFYGRGVALRFATPAYGRIYQPTVSQHCGLLKSSRCCWKNQRVAAFCQPAFTHAAVFI